MKGNDLLVKNVRYLTRKQKRALGEVERTAGVAAGYISRVDNGSNHPTIEVAEAFASTLNEELGRILTEDISLEEKTVTREWIRLSEDMPPCGKCLEVITRDNTIGGRITHLYPVWYLERPYEKKYSFFIGGVDNPLLKSHSEVLAWRFMHDNYEESDIYDE